MKDRSARFWWILPVTAGLFHFCTLRSGHHWGDDFAFYIRHAQNIVVGRPYAETGYILNPFYPSISPLAYPPLLPLMLAPIYALFGLHLLAMKRFIVFCFVGALVCLWPMLRRRLPAKESLLCLGAFAFHPFLWTFKDNILSDIPFLMFSFLAIALWERSEERPAWGWGALAAMAAAMMTRMAGIVFIGVLFCSGVLVRRKLPVWQLIGLIGLPILAYTLSGYGGTYRWTWNTVPQNVVIYGWSFVGLWINGYSTVAWIILLAALVSLGCFGLSRTLKMRPTPLEFFALGILSLILLFPNTEKERLLIPLLPIFFLYVFKGCHALEQKKWRWVVPLVSAALFLSYGAMYSRLNYGTIPQGVEKAESQQLFDFVRRHTAVEDKFVFFKPRAFALYTGRSALVSHTAPDKALLAYWKQVGVTYVVSSRLDQPSFIEAIRRLSRHWKRVYSNTDFEVWHVDS